MVDPVERSIIANSYSKCGFIRSLNSLRIMGYRIDCQLFQFRNNPIKQIFFTFSEELISLFVKRYFEHSQVPLKK